MIVNTGDDFEHWGLEICPDLDTMLYNLAGTHNPETGWGRAGDSFGTLHAMSLLGGEEWFRLGDQDLALHLRRTEWLRQGITLTEVTDRLRRSFGVPTTILPMCDNPVRTLVHTDEGDLPFQHYFVRLQCEPIVADLSFVGADQARLSEDVREAVAAADLIIFCPSNPYLSLDPILSVPGLRKLLYHAPAPIIAVTPIVAGAALKGPAAKLMRELGQLPSPLTVVDHFADLLDGFVLDLADAELDRAVELPVLVTDTIMTDLASKTRLAAEILEFAARLDNFALQPRSLDAGPAMP
jgi:LPPG:FO 2-phospho-L-lactate transferase